MATNFLHKVASKLDWEILDLLLVEDIAYWETDFVVTLPLQW